MNTASHGIHPRGLERSLPGNPSAWVPHGCRVPYCCISGPSSVPRFALFHHGYLLRSGGESLRSEEGGGKPLPYIGLRTSRDAPVHQRSNHTGEHCGSRRNHRRGGVYPRPFWRPGIHTAGLPERRRYPCCDILMLAPFSGGDYLHPGAPVRRCRVVKSEARAKHLSPSFVPLTMTPGSH